MCITQVCRGLWSKGHKNFPHLCIRTPVESLHTNLRATKPLSYLEFGVKSYWIVPSEPFPFSPHPRHNNRNPKPFLFIPDTQQREPPPTMPPPPPSQKAPNPLSSLPLSSLTLSSSPSSPPSSPSGTDPRPNQARPAHQPPFPSARRTRPRALPAPAALHDRPRQHAARLLRPTRPAPSDLSPPPPLFNSLRDCFGPPLVSTAAAETSASSSTSSAGRGLATCGAPSWSVTESK